LPGRFAKAIEESRKFAVGEYADALMAGDALPAPRRKRDYAEASAAHRPFTELHRRTNLRLEIMRFTKELLRSEAPHHRPHRRALYGHRSRCCGRAPEFDPAIAAIIGPYAAC